MTKDFYKEVDPEKDKLIVDSHIDSFQNPPEKLRNFIRDQRLKVADGVESTRVNVGKLKSDYNDTEKKLNKKISKIYVDDRNRLGLGLASVVVAMMTGSIMTRRSHASLKVFTPILLGTITTFYAFPATTCNVMDNIYEYELKHFPVLAKKQREIKIELQEGLEDCYTFSQKTKLFFNKWFN